MKLLRPARSASASSFGTFARVYGAIVCAAMLFVLIAAPSGWARTVKFETAAPLTDQSDDSLQAALATAIDSCIRGALAMGLSWISFQGAALQGGQLVVQMIATDEQEGQDDASGTPAPDSELDRMTL